MIPIAVLLETAAPTMAKVELAELRNCVSGQMTRQKKENVPEAFGKCRAIEYSEMLETAAAELMSLADGKPIAPSSDVERAFLIDAEVSATLDRSRASNE